MAVDPLQEIKLINKIVEDCKKKTEDAKIKGEKIVTCGTSYFYMYDPDLFSSDETFYQDYQISFPGKSNATNEAYLILDDFYRKEQRDGTMRVNMSRYTGLIKYPRSFASSWMSSHTRFIGNKICVSIEIELKND